MDIELDINDHFEDYLFDWNYETYLLVGGYGSSKSYNTALKIMLKCMEEKRKVLVVREVFDTHKDSTFALFEDLIETLELGKICKAMQSPLKIKFKNGSTIIFKGMDKPAKLKSIHNVSIVWIEEASEVKYEGFKELIGRLRHPTLSLHMILTNNPVSKSNWVYKHFFIDNKKKIITLNDKELYKKRVIVKDNVYYHHSLPDDNYFLPSTYIARLENLKTHDPDLYRVARKGQFGINGKKVLPQFTKLPHYQILEMIERIKVPIHRVGMDFGFVTSYNAIVRMVVDDTDPDNKDLYIYWQYYKNQMTDDRTAKEISEFKETQELIRADNAEPKTIRYYCQKGFNMIGPKKATRLENTKKIKRFRHIYCSEDCEDVVEELEELTYKTDKNDEIIEDEFNIDPHTLSAIWYGLAGYEVADLKENYDEEVYNKGRGIINPINKRKGGAVF
jgi:phage terminase large subunit